MNAILYWAASFALVCFALGMVFAAIRLLRGPTAQDRVLAASILVFSALSSRPVFHEVIITLLLIVSSPVTAMLLMRAAVYRNRLTEADADLDAR